MLLIHSTNLDSMVAAATIINNIKEIYPKIDQYAKEPCTDRRFSFNNDPEYQQIDCNLGTFKSKFISTVSVNDAIKSALENNETVLIVGFSPDFTKEPFSQFYQPKTDLIWIDHHRSSVDFIKSEIGSQLRYKGIISVQRSSAYLTWVFFHQNDVYNGELWKMPKVITLADDYECSVCELGGHYLNAALYYTKEMYDPCCNIWSDLLNDDIDHLASIMEYGKSVFVGKKLERSVNNRSNRGRISAIPKSIYDSE